MNTRCRWVLLGAVCLVVLAGYGDGIVIPDHPDGWLAITYHRVAITAEEGLVTTAVDQEFRNDTGRPVEGTYVFPLPPGALVQGFTLWVGDEPVAAELLPADEAREIYLSYLQRNLDPALLEYVGRGAFRARVFPIGPGESRRIRLEYSELLVLEGGVYRYVYPLETERFSTVPLEEVTIDLLITSSEAIGSIYSPSHNVSVTRPDPFSAHVGYVERNTLPTANFVLYYGYTGLHVGADLITYAAGDEDGLFLLLVVPPPLGDEPPVPKDLVLVIDTSGSMWGEKIVQAREAAEFILRNLGPADRFGVITFSDQITPLTEGLTEASADRVVDTVAKVRTIYADGWTDIHGALTLAMSWFAPDERPKYVLFLTDGLPTRGPTDTDTIVRDVTAANKAAARLFAFGVGYDVNTHLLDLLSQGNRGTTTYVVPGENLEGALSAFYRKIAEPALTGLSLAVAGVSVYDLYPRALPDLFYGGQIMVVGRFVGNGAAEIVVRGQRREEELALSFDREFPDSAVEAAFLPRLWASRKIGHLLNRVRLEGESEEVVEQIIALATLYGIATPYTSYLVREEERDMLPPPAAYAAPAGASSVGAARATQDLAEAEKAVPTDLARDVAGRVFVLREGVWTETTYTDDASLLEVVYLSEAYLTLLEHVQHAGPILALGEEIIFQAGEVFVRIGPHGKTQLSPEDIQALTGTGS